MPHHRRGRWAAMLTAATLTIGSVLAAPAAAAPLTTTTSTPSATAAKPATLTNLAHLDWLMDTATPTPEVGHTTYRLAQEPDLTMPWTYADARSGGTFERIGGGRLDPVTGHWSQGAYNADDISRAAVVYLRHWEQTRIASSRDRAYELLRSLAYLQTTTGANAGNVVLWIQPDGALNPSAEPVELPDPSDSDASYWLARTIWAFGEGYAAFKTADPAFAAFLKDRLALARAAVDRQVLDTYGTYTVTDGLKVPSWLIVDGADASAEAVLGLTAYLGANPGDAAAKETTRKLAEGIAAMGQPDTTRWPYGAILPWAQSRSIWHGWASQMPAALAKASTTLTSAKLLTPAVTDSVAFTPTLLTAGGPDNGWMPTPGDRSQIAYGVDSRVQSLLAVSDAGRLPGLADLAAVQASWYFGANRAGEPMYDRATGVTFDGISPDGVVNRNSGAESTIHGQLTMLALDARPAVSARAQATPRIAARSGLSAIEAESASRTTGTVRAPAEAWTGESLYSGSTLVLARGQKAWFTLPKASTPRTLEPVSWRAPNQSSQTVWFFDGTGKRSYLSHSGLPQGISPTPGVLLPGRLSMVASAGATPLSVLALNGTVTLDAILVRPVVSRLTVAGPSGSSAATELVQVAGASAQKARVGATGRTSAVRVYDAKGALVRTVKVTGTTTVTVPGGGFAIATR